ncbi:MAG: DUF4974 domain-containing protein [Paramuribaculum sp.]|nr:DUF4974 domain-containing protein [Paramuribaculum sp.]
MKEEISYIARRYKPGKFSASKGWKRLNIVAPFRWTRMKIAAVVGGTIFLSAAAAVIIHQYSYIQDAENSIVEAPVANPKVIIKVIDFENTPLPDVLSKIKDVYGVEVINLPENPDEYRLSLHYEGNPVDLIETINDILDTKMTVKE